MARRTRTPRGRFWVMPLALLLDAILGEPPARFHPVVWIGTLIARLERQAPRHGPAALAAGAAIVGAVAGSAVAGAWLLERLSRRLPWPMAVLVDAWLLKTLLSVRALLIAAQTVERPLATGNLSAARESVTALVSRDAESLTVDQLTSAAIESLAENSVDSVVAPLLFYAAGGLPAAAGYRAANTLDAMIGYRGEYEQLGKCAARLDDLLNIVPARITSGLLLIAGAICGGTLPSGVAITRRDHGRTASPNAGWPMSTMAGLLYTRLEKPGHYVLGADLPEPDLSAIDQAAEIVKAVAVLALPLAIGLQSLRRSGMRRQPCQTG
ncbi:MAG: adenosylcobinamide-phosphate synthase CbiB [Chloroflexota bacterium]